MTTLKEPKKYRVTRWKELIFPTQLIIDHYRVLSRKRSFPAFWIVKEESIPLRSVASIQIARGLLFSKIIVENSGGPFPITVNGIPNRHAREARETIECFENVKPITKKPDPASKKLWDTDQNEIKTESKHRPAFNPFRGLIRQTKPTNVQSDDIVVESWENSWSDVDIEKLDDITDSIRLETEKPVKNEKCLVSQTVRGGLPSIDEALDESDRKKSASPGWIDEIVTPVSKSSGDKFDQ